MPCALFGAHGFKVHRDLVGTDSAKCCEQTVYESAHGTSISPATLSSHRTVTIHGRLSSHVYMASVLSWGWSASFGSLHERMTVWPPASRSAWHIRSWSEGEPGPDGWSRLSEPARTDP